MVVGRDQTTCLQVGRHVLKILAAYRQDFLEKGGLPYKTEAMVASTGSVSTQNPDRFARKEQETVSPTITQADCRGQNGIQGY